MRCVLVVVGLAGCLHSELTQCEDVLCPAHTVCAPAAPGCYPPDRVAACDGLSDGATCQSISLADGRCRGGVCVPPGCGDGIVEANEQCDGVATGSCVDHGFYSADGLACTSDCRVDTSGCGGGTCGDSMINGPELCDGAPPTRASCISLGYDIGVLGCSSICGPDVTACGRIGFTMEPVGPSMAIGDFAEVGGVEIGVGAGIFRRIGGTWIADTVTLNGPLLGIWAASPTDIYAVGFGGLIVHYDGTAWTQM